MNPHAVQQKICRKCLRLKEEADFYKKGQRRDSRCKVCIAAEKRAWFKRKMNNRKNNDSSFRITSANSSDRDFVLGCIQELVAVNFNGQ